MFQAEIERLKYELSELKITSGGEITSLKSARHVTQKTLQEEREINEKQSADSRNQLSHFKSLCSSTKAELDLEKTRLKNAVSVVIV